MTDTSFVSHIIADLSRQFGQTPDLKRQVNNSITRTGHGSIFLGSSSRLEGGDRNIRILVGAHFSGHGVRKIDTFGGKCERDEETIRTVVRETIEEVFNIPADYQMVDAIIYYLNINTHLYYISQIGSHSVAYSYIFDVSVLGEFIRIINEVSGHNNVSYFIPTNDGLANIGLYLQSNIQFSDMSSFDGVFPRSGSGTTIKLVDFLKTRNISHKMQEIQRRLHTRRLPGLDEVKYLSFVSLSKLVAAAPSGRYRLYNFNKNRREDLQMRYFFANLLNKDIFRFILSYQ